jgi:toxic protein SymE
MDTNYPLQSTTGRKLKVRPKHFSRALRRTVAFPEIRLCGKWLQQMGFACGQTVSIEHRQNQLIITVISNR